MSPIEEKQSMRHLRLTQAALGVTHLRVIHVFQPDNPYEESRPAVVGWVLGIEGRAAGDHAGKIL